MVHCSAVALFRRRYKGLMRPMILKSRVRGTTKASSNPPCLGEMTALMACWKLHRFDDQPCKREITTFTSCAQEMRASPDARIQQQPDKKWTPEEINLRLRKFVWPQ